MTTIALVLNETEPCYHLAEYLAISTDISVVGVFNSPVLLLASNGIVAKDCIVVMSENEHAFKPRLWAMLRIFSPSLKYIVLLRNRTSEKLEYLLAMGVSGLVRIDAPAPRILHTIQKVAGGELDLDASLLQSLKHRIMEQPNPLVVELKDLKIDMNSKQDYLKGDRVKLSKLEYRLLEYLAKNHGDAIGKGELFANVWELSDPASGTDDQLWSCIKRLRGKIEPNPQKPIYLTTVVGQHSYALGLDNQIYGD